MIEIIVVILLCNVNFRNAKARAKSGGAAIAYTLGLWFGGEILGAVFGIAASGGEVSGPVYIAALLFAAGGGVASYFIAKSGRPVSQTQPQMYPPPNASQNMMYPNQQPQAVYAQQQAQPLPPAAGQQVQQTYTEQQAQPLPPQPGQQPQPVYTGQQVQSSTSQATGQQPASMSQQPQAVYAQQQSQTLPPAAGQQVQQAQPLPPQPGQQPAAQVQAPQAQAQAQGQTAATAMLVFSAKKVMGQFLVSSVTIEVNGVPYQTGFNQPINIIAPAGNVQIDCYLNYMGRSGVAQLLVALAPNQTYQLDYKSPMVVTGSGTLNIVQVS